MKVLITESQLKEIIQRQTFQNLLESEINEAEMAEADRIVGLLKEDVENPQAVYNTLQTALGKGQIGMGAVPGILNRLFGGGGQNGNQEAQEEKLNIFQKLFNWFKNFFGGGNNQNEEEFKTKDPNFNEKVKAVYAFMSKSTGIFGKKPEDVPISAENIVKECEKTGFDIPLLLAQGHWESHFGADPGAKRCQRTKSIFSVGLYDNGKDAVSYASFDDSVPAYIRLMQKNYLGDNKTVGDLLSPGGFVNQSNKRYASSKTYESNLAKTRNSILRKYPVLAS